MTDKWISPIACDAAKVMPVPIDSGTLWNTYSAALSVTEAIVTRGGRLSESVNSNFAAIAALNRHPFLVV